MKIGRLNRASFAKTARRAMFLFAFAVLGTQAATVATVDGTGYETLEAAIAAAEPVDGVVTYEICGKAEVSATGWIQVLKSGLSNVKKVAFVGKTEDAEICIAGDLAILADQQYDIDVSFRNLKLSKPNPEYGGDYGHSTNYFTTWLRNTGAAENTVTYENCTFPNGACNNQYGKTVYTNCTFANGTTGLYNLWIYGGSVEMDGGVFTGTRGMKVYTEGTPATAPSVEVKGTAFSGLTEKAAIVVSKAATVEFAEVSVADCPKGLFQKDIEGSSDDQKVTVTANGSKISGSFAITANREPETAKTEFNITGGMFTAEVPSDYCADGFTVKATTDADGNTVYGVVEKTELVNYVTLELVFGDNVADEDVVAAKALYAQEKYETCKAANEAYMALFGVTWGKGYLDVTDNTAPLYKYAGRSGSVSEVRFYIHGTLAGFTSLQSSGNQIDCTVGGNHQISRTSYSIIGVDGADGKAKLTDGNVQAYVAGGYASMFTASGKLTIDNIEFTSTTSTTVGASATRATENDTENEVASAEMEIKNCTFRGRLYVYDNFENQGKMTYSIHNCVFDGSNYSGDSNAYAIFAQCKGGNNLVIKDNAIAGFARGINIDHANVHATIEGNTISVTDTGRSCIQLSSIATANIVGNTLELTGGNAITLHEKLLTLGVVPEVSISGNTVTGTGYLVYDDAVANGKEFTSDNLKLTYATDNTVAATVDTTQGVKDATKYELSGTVATTLHSVDFAAFVKALTDAGYTFDGSTHALAQNGKLTVKWSPVSGCYDTREGHECTVGNVAATANTPKRVNSGLTQFQLFEGESHAVNVKNVAFVYEPAAFTVCENSGWKGTFTAEQAPAGQIFLMNTGDVTFEGCSFDKVVLTSFNCTGTSTVKDCSFKNVYNSYAVKDIRGATISVTGCTFENCGAAVMVSMVSSTVKVGAVTISGNTFKNVDVAGTAPDDKVGTRGLVQIASSGDYADTAFDFSGNTATDCGPVLRQLNTTVSFGTKEKAQLNTLASAGGSLYTTDSIKRVVAKVGETAYETLDEAIKAVRDGETIVVNAGEYKLNGSLTYTGKAFTIQAAEGAKVSFDMSAAVALHGAKITFSGVTFDYKTNGDYIGLQHADTLVYNDCTVNGKVFLYAASETFNRCTFTQTAVDYNVWTYGAKAVTFNGCTFNCVGKSVLVYNEGSISKTELAVSDCEFKASAPVEGKAAIEIDTSLMEGGATITIDAKTTAAGFAEGSNSKNTLWNDKKQTQDTNTNTTVTVAGETVDETKKATATSLASGTLETSVAKLLPVDPRTLGYATSGKAEALPATPDMNGEVVNVTAAQAQYVLDGAYGPIDGKTINFTESINDTLILGRASKYDGSGTVYRHGSHAGEALSYADFIAYKNQSGWTQSCYYERTVENVTFTANEGVTVKNFEADGGAHIYAGTAPVYDYVRDTGSWVTEGSCYFKRAILKNITFKGLTFKAKTDINTSESTTVYDGFTFKDCTFDLGTTADGNQAIRYYNENNNGNVKNLVVEGCTFKTCSQGVYTMQVKGITVKDSTFTQTGHNAIAIQSQGGDKGPCNHGKVVITGNTFKNIGDRIIRFNNVGMGTTVTITGNTADGNSGKLDKATGKREIVKATTLPVNAADSIKASGNDWGANTVVEGVFIDDYATKLGTEACPYSREQFAAMTRAEYSAAQERLGGTLYVNVGDYAYEKDGVLGNGVRDDTTGQTPDHSKLNAYGENGYLGEKNDGANGHAVVFVGGTITSGVTGYTSIDNIGTSLLLAVPAYTKVAFKKTAFKNVLSFDYQLYTSPWSQLGGLTFNGCTFDGIIVGAIASQELAFNGCTFNNYVNTASANNSNPTWIRPAYGNWTKGDNEGQGTDFRSLTKITFENNTVTSTRPVKFERIAQWEMATTVTATNNTFTITPQEGDKDEKKTKNVGLYFGANAKFDLVIDNNAKSDETAALYTAVYSAPTGVTYAGLPAGSTVKNTAGEEVTTEDALAWKTTDKITLKTTEEVASVTNAKGVSVNFATLSEAVKAAQAGETVTLLADITLASKQSIRKELTLDLNGKTLTGTAYQTLSLGSGANVTIRDSSTGQNGKITNGYTGNSYPRTIYLDASGAAALTVESGIVESNPNIATLQSVAIDTDNQKRGPYVITITGGKVLVPESSTKGRAIVASKNTTLNITGGEIVGGLHGVDVYGGSKTAIKGGSISARVVDTGVIKAAYGLRAKGTASVTIGAADGTADVVSVAGIKMDDNGYKLNVPAVTVNSGTIAGPVYSVTKGTIVFTVQATSEDVLRFADDTAVKFLPSNLELRAKDIDGKTMYYVAAKPVAAIGTIGYETLEAALAAAKDGETVKLLADVTVAGQLVAEKALTLDLGGKTVTSTYAIPASLSSGEGRYALLTKAPVTVKNGTFAAGQARALSAYANLTLEDATITSELAGGNCCVAFSAANCVYTVVNTKIVGAYAIANFAHNATIAITGSALEGSGCGLYHNGSNYGLKLTVSDTTINGAIDQAIGEGKDPSGVYLSGSLDGLANAENQNGAKGHHQATFTRCTIKGNTGVEVKYTDLTLEDCTVVATTKEPSYTQNNNGMAALGFAVVSTDNATGNATPKPEGTITITGADGSYTGLVGLGSLDSVKTGFAAFEDAHYAVSGGTFSNAVLPEYCAAGFIPTANDDGTYGVKAGAYVAAIGTTGYETLEAALAAADAGATVKMLADVVLTEKQTIAKALVLDLNGKTISSTVDQFITIVKGGDLTVNDTTGEGCIKNTVTESWGGTIKMTGGVLTVNGGTIAANSATSEYSPTIEADTSSSATINVVGGRIEADRTGNARAINLRTQANVTLNVTGGEIVGSQNGIYSFAGNTINISAGVVAGKAGSAVYSSGKNRVLISGGTLTPGGTASALYISMGSSATVTIGREGGKVDDVTIPSIDVGGCTTTVTLLSGTVGAFKNWGSMTVAKVSQGKDTLLVGTDITACLPGSDLLCQLDAASGLYEIVKLTVENAAAIVTHDDVETPYHTVEQACKAVTDGDTLTLKVDHTGSLGITKKNVTIDLGGKTLTGASNSHALSFNQSAAGDNTVTVKNGTIVAKGQDAACIRATSGDAATTLTLVLGDDLTLEVGSNNWSGKVVLDKGARTASPRAAVNNGGLLVTEDGTDWIYGETETAFTHAAGTEVTLLNDWYCTDYEGAVKVPDTSAFGSAKLNLDGHTIKHYGAGAAIVMGNDAKPSEGTAVKTLEISNGMIETSQYGAAVCGSNKSLTLDGVSVKTTGDDKLGIYANGMTSGNTVTLKNGSAVVSEKATGIYFPGAGTLTVEDSNVTGGMSGIEVRAGVLNVSGTSVIESTAAEFSFTNDDNGITATGAAVAAVKHTVGNDLAVTITGGTFKGPRGFYENDPNVANPGTVTVSISGGVFSTDVEKKYLADGCKTVQQTIDGTLYYVVGPAITQIGVTLGGEKKEMPFPDAWLVANIGADAATWTTEALEEKAENELAKWQCYLFGLDPSKKDAKVVATAGQGTDEAIPLAVANADASASPLVTGGYVKVAYVLKGSNDRTVWTQVATSNKRDGLAIPLTDTTYKFYRVDVTVTSAEGN